MRTESEVSFEVEAPICPDKVLVQENEACTASSTPNNNVVHQPAKKPTRQWAAWTRQEEESFFTALRQVGKNFEKITRRVQSKNKDQVRHYYYRLVRRMNKLLGPGLCLDAKNSKDTNGAMLRWWSLLEKYSCKASKLHLKPRRFKIFIEALEHQLLKDRKKNVRKRPFQGENYPPTTPNAVANQSRLSGHDGHTVKLVLVDRQNIPKLSPGKSSLKRSMSVGVNRGNNKGDTSAMKPPRQRKKPGIVSSATYREWEKAAIAGVSLVADAAEHLERTATDKVLERELGQKYCDPVGSGLSPLPTFQQNFLIESATHTSSKFKLQLFPIDDSTRRALEMDKHNPYLELTLSTRKRISSVVEHLSRKWGNSSPASGEFMLFPYNAQRENLVGCQSWAQDSIMSAADVYAMIGSPPVFRLRYGWFSNIDSGSITLQAQRVSCCSPGEHDMDVENREGNIADLRPISTKSANSQSVELYKDQVASLNKDTASALTPTAVRNEMNGYLSADKNNNLPESSDLIANPSWAGKDACDGTVVRHLEDVDDPRLSNGTALSAGEWADSLTNISIGDLLSGASQDMNTDYTDQPIVDSSQCIQQIPFSCDSFDAAIAAHISRQKDKLVFEPVLASHSSSIWDAEETCDAFSFRKNQVVCQEGQSSAGFTSRLCKEVTNMALGSNQLVEEVDRPSDDFTPRDSMNECQSDPQILENSGKDFGGLADIYWPDSLGPLDLDIPSSKYRGEDLIISDSGLNRLIASSLDTFQSCSFLGLDKKELSSTTVEGRETASFSNFKIGS